MMITLSRRIATIAFVTLVTQARAEDREPLLFRVISMRDEIVIGLTPGEFDHVGNAPGVERLARKLVADGQLTAWQYVVGRGTDGTIRHVAVQRVAILRNDTQRIEPYKPALPVSQPPAE